MYEQHNNLEKTKYICKKVIPFLMGSVGLIATKANIEKTFIILAEADEYIEEQLQKTGLIKEVLIITTEDKASKFKDKIDKLNLKHKKHIFISLNYSFNIEENFSNFKNETKQYGLIFIDSLLSFYLGNKNDNSDAKKFMIPFVRLADERNQNIIFLHHLDKEGKRIDIAGAFIDATRLTYYVTKETQLENISRLRFEVQKQNDELKFIKKLDNITSESEIASFLIDVFCEDEK